MNITFDESMERLRALSDPRGIAVWEKMYGTMDGYLGVGVTKIKTLAKELKKDHDRALQLWETGILDAQLLSIYTEEPKKVTLDQISRQLPQIRFADTARRYGEEIIAPTPHAWALALEYYEHPEPMYRVCAYGIVSELSVREKKRPNNDFFPFLEKIHQTIQSEDNWVKDNMNFTLITFGSRNAEMNRRVLAICADVGKITVDYGDTSCVTPDAPQILTSERIKKKLGI